MGQTRGVDVFPVGEWALFVMPDRGDDQHRASAGGVVVDVEPAEFVRGGDTGRVPLRGAVNFPVCALRVETVRTVSRKTQSPTAFKKRS